MHYNFSCLPVSDKMFVSQGESRLITKAKTTLSQAMIFFKAFPNMIFFKAFPIKTKHRKSKHNHNQWILCKEEIFNTWVCLKSEDNKTFNTEDVIHKTSTVTKLNKRIVDLFKEFVKNVLNEFKGK